eukprot:4603462-Amphidinium_carterae.3
MCIRDRTTTTRNGRRPDTISHEEILRKEKILELYIMLPEKALEMWKLRGCLPAQFITNGTDPKHAWYNFHTEIEYAVNDFINVYMYNHPTDFPEQGQQLHKQDYYLTVVHTTERLLTELTEDLPNIQSRTGRWFQRKTLDHQYQIRQDRQR